MAKVEQHYITLQLFRVVSSTRLLDNYTVYSTELPETVRKEMIGEKVSFEAVPKNVGSEVTSGGRLIADSGKPCSSDHYL